MVGSESVETAALAARPGGQVFFLTLLGSVRVACRAEQLRVRNRKARAVLACLALAEGQELTRERIAGLLWSDSSEEKARASLRQVVHELREALPGALRAERLTIRIEPGTIRHDLDLLLREITAGEVGTRLLETTGIADRLLDGFDDLDPAFTEWLREHRGALHKRLVTALEAQLGSAEGRRVRAAARALLNLDATHEEACRCVMLDAARAGDVAGALRAYEALWNVLGDDFDMEPSAATQALVAEIKAGRIGPAPPVPVAPVILPTPPAPAEPAMPPVPRSAQAAPLRMALLVEQFAVHGVPGDRVHLVHGFRHDLIACLVRFREWLVADGGELARGAAHPQRVSSYYAISAVAYQAGDGISLVLTVREMGCSIVSWSERCNIDLASWTESQRELVRGIAAALKSQISAARLAALPLRTAAALTAHDSWLLGQSVMRGFRGDRYTRARELFEAAIAEDPNFSPAYSSLAQSYNGGHIANSGTWRSRATEARALALARTAVECDPLDSRAHLVTGWSLAMSGQTAPALPHVLRAVQLNPNDSWTLISAALFHAFAGLHDAARRLADEALEMTLVMSPTLWGYQVVVAYLRGDDQAALAACERAQDVIRTLPAWRAAALWNLGRELEAREAAERFFTLVREAWTGREPASETRMGRWLLHQYPFTERENWERLRRGIRGAGIPAEDVAFGQWYAV